MCLAIAASRCTTITLPAVYRFSDGAASISLSLLLRQALQACSQLLCQHLSTLLVLLQGMHAASCTATARLLRGHRVWWQRLHIAVLSAGELERWAGWHAPTADKLLAQQTSLFDPAITP